jgi:hypothetical protein
LQPLGVAGRVAQLKLAGLTASDQKAASDDATSVSLFDQGLTQVLQAAVVGLEPKQPYVLALAQQPDGNGTLEPLADFTTNPAGAAIVNATGPIRQVVQEGGENVRRYLVIARGSSAKPGAVVQIQR